MQVDFWGGACVVIQTADIRILCDPWFTPGAFEGSWNRLCHLEEPEAKIGFCDYIYISHIHPDHFDEQFLRRYLGLHPGSKIIVSERRNNFLYSRCQLLGFPSVALCKLQYGQSTIRIIPDESNGISSIDSLLIVLSNGITVVNTNDMNLSGEHIDELGSLDIDILLHKYCWPGSYPALFDMDQIHKKLEQNKAVQNAKFAYIDRVNLFSPRVSVPFAGSCVWMHHPVDVAAFRSIYDPIELKELSPQTFIPHEDGTSSLKINNSYELERINERRQSIVFNPGGKVEYVHDSVFNIIDSQKLVPYIRKSVLKAFTYARKRVPDNINGILLIFSDPFTIIIDFTNVAGSVSLCQNMIYEDCKKLCDSQPYSSCMVIVTLNHFLSLLVGISHWDNAIAGGIALHYRNAGHDYNRLHYDFLNFFHI